MMTHLTLSRITAAAAAAATCLQAANNGDLQQLAIFGTSMRSLADTQALVAALTAVPAAATAAAAAVSRGGFGVTDTELQVDSSSAEQSSNAAAQQVDVLQLAYRQGCVVEVPSPDYAAHGVGVAVHLFNRGRL
jgi:hypothetical protein